MITGHATISFKDHLNWYFSDFQNFRLITILGVLLGLVLAVRRSDLGFSNMAIIFGVTITVMIVLSTVLTLLLYGLSYFRMTPEQKSINWKINEERLLITDESGSEFLTPWVHISQIVKSRKGWILRRKVGQSQWITNRTFTPEMAQHFEALVAEKFK